MLDFYQTRLDRILRDVLRAEALHVAKAECLRDQRFQDVVAVIVLAPSGDARKETQLRHLVNFADGQDLAIDHGGDAVDRHGVRRRGEQNCDQEQTLHCRHRQQQS